MKNASRTHQRLQDLSAQTIELISSSKFSPIQSVSVLGSLELNIDSNTILECTIPKF